MTTLINFNQIEDSTISLKKVKPPLVVFYSVIVLFVSSAIVSLSYIRTDISVRTTGVIRPNIERTEVKSLMSGIIQNINFTEGGSIKKGDMLAYIQDNNSKSKRILNDYELNQRHSYIRDLELLTTTNNINEAILNQLQSPLFRQQISKFLHQRNEKNAKLKKVRKELEMSDTLLGGGVIVPKEFFDKQTENTQIQEIYNASINEQLSLWQQDLLRYKLELSQFTAQGNQIIQEGKLHEIRAPISGTIQGINTKYTGGVIQSGETFGVISPETDLIAECYMPTRDIGLIKPNQEVKYQIDAFDYKYFGVLTGKILSIDNDFTVVNNKPVFKVRCTFDSTQLQLKNGFSGKLKKGLTFQARFFITQRTLWQLLWDKIDDWLNPNAPNNNIETCSTTE
jgi:membrane fusion protein, peptide pheromone/bacteriocin exporter